MARTPPKMHVMSFASPPPVTLDHAAAYRVMTTHDARFDGRLFVGVTSTRVYCRPVCRVRTPLARHCRFFANAASAEHAGFRPCRRCRPELAPGLSLVDSPHALASHAARVLDRAAREGLPLTMPALAAQLGVTDRHLRRIFTEQHGVAPLEYLTTQRLLFAKQLLHDTSLPILQVALLAGFGSLRRFNDAFATRYRMPPSALRASVDGAVDTLPAASSKRITARPRREAAGEITLRLAYRPPYDIDGVLRFFAARALPGVEVVDLPRRRLHRTLRIASTAPGAAPVQGRITVHFDSARTGRDEVTVSIAPALAPVVGIVVDRVRHALDLDAQPLAIDAALAELPGPRVAGVRLPGSFDPFETMVRIVLGQQITVAAARTIATRLLARFGTTLSDDPSRDPSVDRLFPDPSALSIASDDELGSLGIVGTRIRAIRALSTAIVDRRVGLTREAPIDTTLAALHTLPGFGPWTLQLAAMRVLGWPDAFPATDVGVLRALELDNPGAALARAVAWSPWRSYAVIRLWQSLETGT
jgi:AraC family transcriptional regulator, regulatory protein of adaptative response / DNA-3-methyladenine glycosylase II